MARIHIPHSYSRTLTCLLAPLRATGAYFPLTFSIIVSWENIHLCKKNFSGNAPTSLHRSVKQNAISTVGFAGLLCREQGLRMVWYFAWLKEFCGHLRSRTRERGQRESDRGLYCGCSQHPWSPPVTHVRELQFIKRMREEERHRERRRELDCEREISIFRKKNTSTHTLQHTHTHTTLEAHT